MTTSSDGASLRQRLAAALGLMAIVVAVAAVATLAAGLQPNAKQWNERPRVVVPQLLPGQFAYVEDSSTFGLWRYDLLFVRLPEGELQAFLIAFVNGRHQVGWVNAWHADQACDRFEPDFAAGRFRCHLAAAPSGLAPLSWSLRGEGLSPAYGPLTRVRGVVEGDEFVILGYE
jgi:hypothetical protein